MAQNASLPFSCICILLFFSMAAANYISHDAMKADGGQQGRSVIGVELSTEDCPTDFSKVDYSPLLKKCTGPPYQAKPCCDGLREVSCSYAEELNDVEKNTCAYDMFSAINEKGMYPSGLFFKLCTQFSNKDRNLPCDDDK